MHKIIFIQILLMVFIYRSISASELVNENFNDENFTFPLNIDHIFGGSWTYDSINRIGSGFSVRGNHAEGDLIAELEGATSYLDDGVYFRYWVYFSSDYSFPGDQGTFENNKMLKFGGGGSGNIEFIYKNSGNGGPHSLQLYWNKKSTGECCGGTGNAETPLFPGNEKDIAGNDFLTKGIWHKIEIYLELPSSGNSIVHVQVDDSDVYFNTDADILPASDHDGAQQFVSIRAHESAPPEKGYWYLDDILIIHDEGDLCNNEPDAPNDSIPPVKTTGLKISP